MLRCAVLCCAVLWDRLVLGWYAVRQDQDELKDKLKATTTALKELQVGPPLARGHAQPAAPPLLLLPLLLPPTASKALEQCLLCSVWHLRTQPAAPVPL